MLKSVREAKLVTSWINPHAGYEAALSSFVHALLQRRDSNLFLADLQASVADARLVRRAQRPDAWRC